MTFVRCVNVGGETVPEYRYRHGVIIEDAVPPNPPEPTTLQKQNNDARLSYFPSHDSNVAAVSKALFVYLEDKHLPPQHGHCIKVSIADVRGLVVWQLGRPRRRDVFPWSDGFWHRRGLGGGGGREDGRRGGTGARFGLGRRIQVGVRRDAWGIGWRISGGLFFWDRRGGGGVDAGFIVRGERRSRRSICDEGRTLGGKRRQQERLQSVCVALDINTFFYSLPFD